ncbi:ATP synthase F1 subunit epsilon [Aristophania vespae]|uniref:ATP synthase epsilon chain n=1 Tax=Aristophania vespae TaxID=2697033 RepID=A0A6P1NBZ5_9PROT|nr:ATP synthase F1 subunit epsilon [Aristophania vespae]QHI95058.1 ATP synthase F1 subunit epsilon [Aristophania vespae]UMM64241.1 ATP synthase epsilon chain [Aristophania vespae]
MTLRAEIVSPLKRHIDQDVDMVVVPGTEGNIAAMPGRSPVMLQLRGGIVTLYKDDQVVARLFISGGFVDMTSDRCTILADSVRALEDLSPDDARQRLDQLEAQWSHVGPGEYHENDSLTLQIQSVRAEIEAGEEFAKGGFN